MGEGKSTVHVKMRVDKVEFEIECPVSELKEAIDKLLAAVANSSIDDNVEVSVGKRGGSVGFPSRGETCKSVILRLWSEGWLGIGRGLGEVHGEMGRRGFHYDRTAVAHALVDLVREGVLTRVGRPRRYRYLQKRPPPVQEKKKNEEQHR